MPPLSCCKMWGDDIKGLLGEDAARLWLRYCNAREWLVRPWNAFSGPPNERYEIFDMANFLAQFAKYIQLKLSELLKEECQMTKIKNWLKTYGHCQKYLPHVNNLCVEMACTMIDKLETLLSIHYISNIYIGMKVRMFNIRI